MIWWRSTRRRSGGFAGSGADQPIQVAPPVATNASAQSVSDAKPGVIVNLSSTPFVTTSANPIPGVTVNQDQVLVAQPPSVPATCAGTPLPSFCDSITDAAVVVGSSGGGNTFIAGTGSETFGDTGTAGGDAIDFGNVPTSVSAPLDVNVSGGPAQGPSGSLADFTAVAGSATYSFTTSGSNFVNFTGSANGNTTFLAGKVGGYAFAASGGNDAVDFSAVTSTGITVDLSGGTSGSVSGFANGNPDSISGLTTVIGSPNGGNTLHRWSGPGRLQLHGQRKQQRVRGRGGDGHIQQQRQHQRGHGGHGQRHLHRSGRVE